MTAAFEKLLEKYRSISLLEQISGLLSWDQETMMPKGSGEMRAAQMGELATLLHEKATDPTIGGLLTEVDPSALSEIDQAHFREMRISYNQATKIPVKLASEFASLTSHSQGIWSKARQAQDFSAFAPTLARVVELTREKAQCLREGDQRVYDVMLGQYEYGMTSAELDTLFTPLQEESRALRSKIFEQKMPEKLEGHFPKQMQLALSHELAQCFGYPFDHGRIDLSTHPFSSGNFDDTRITTRVDESDPWNCLYSTIHEVGHSVYEYGIARSLMNKPAGIFASMGVHESQSRFSENQIGRSRAFMNLLAPKMAEYFGMKIDPETLYAKVNRVNNGYIRTEADELQYNLHVILRYQLERDLIGGALEVKDLEAAWNHRFEADFGMKVPHAGLGILQDVHWSLGLFGYFPTYTLGNIYAASLLKKIHTEIPNLYEEVSNGDNQTWLKWMQENVHKHGRIYGGAKLIERATGEKPNVASLIDYLKAKFSELYQL